MTVILPCWRCERVAAERLEAKGRADPEKPAKRCPVCRGRGHLTSTEYFPPEAGETEEQAIARLQKVRRTNVRNPFNL